MNYAHNNNVLIGINGASGSGKSTAVEFLKSHYQLTEYILADPIKKIGLVLGFKYEELYGTQEQKMQINEFWGISGREFMQKFGTEIGREKLREIIPQMNKVWIRLFEKYCEENKDKNIIVSDVRRGDEADSIKERNGIIIKIIRPNNDKWEVLGKEHKKHSSETAMEKEIIPDYTIINSGSLELLRKRIIGTVFNHYMSICSSTK